ncbi:MAG: ATP-binding protein [Nitrospinae bacterium]|nr:ATP-binding protein [Nitrospinota bacterium]
MAEISKGRSPFSPGQPVPVELFAGRQEQIERIMTRGVGQVALGKPYAIFVQGEYGIGKSSIASFVQWRAEREYNLHGIYVSLGGCKNLEDVAEAVLKATFRSGAFDPKRFEQIRNFLADLGTQDMFGFSLNLAALKAHAPSLTSHMGMLEFLSETKKRLEQTGVKGIFLVLDEINGIASDPQFANFLKGLVDTNAISGNPLPLLLMLCGVEERRRELIKAHQPIDRIFDVVEIPTMTEGEMAEFFLRAFAEAKMTIEEGVMPLFTYYSAGFPKIMHLIGDSVYWLDKDGIIGMKDATGAVVEAADELGKKFVDQQIMKALRTEEYRSILDKIALAAMGGTQPNPYFMKEDISSKLTDSEKKKFNNFLQRMKKLKVLRLGDVKGEYIFNIRMVWFYIYLQSTRKKKTST